MEKVSCKPVEMCEKTSKSDLQSDPGAATDWNVDLCSHLDKIMIFKQHSYTTRLDIRGYQPGHALSASSLRFEVDETSLVMTFNVYPCVPRRTSKRDKS